MLFTKIWIPVLALSMAVLSVSCAITCERWHVTAVSYFTRRGWGKTYIKNKLSISSIIVNTPSQGDDSWILINGEVNGIFSIKLVHKHSIRWIRSQLLSGGLVLTRSKTDSVPYCSQINSRYSDNRWSYWCRLIYFFTIVINEKHWREISLVNGYSNWQSSLQRQLFNAWVLLEFQTYCSSQSNRHSPLLVYEREREDRGQRSEQGMQKQPHEFTPTRSVKLIHTSCTGCLAHSDCISQSTDMQSFLRTPSSYWLQGYISQS